MAKDDTASKRLAEGIARARAYARYTINLQRAFRDLLSKLERAYGQPTETIAKRRRRRWWNYYLKTMTFRDMLAAGIIVPNGQRNGEAVYIPNPALPESELQRAVERGAVGEHVNALLAIANFLNQMGSYPAHFGNEVATLAQVLRDLQKGIRTPMLDLAPVKSRRRDPTMVSLGRAYVALAVAALQKCGYNRKSAAERVAKKYRGLKKLITEKGSYRIENSTDRNADRDISRSVKLETTIVTWCKDFSRRKPLKDDETADHVYRAALDELKASKSNQLEEYADWLLQQALQIDC